MSNRGLVGGLAILMAVVATGALFLYVKNVRDEADSGPREVDVVVSKEDIPAGTDLNPLLAEGAFATQTFDEDAVVRGAITDLNALKDQTTSVPVVAGEQLTSARLQGSEDLAGGVLGIPDGREAITVALEPQRIVGRDLQRGDRVTIYSTFDRVPPDNQPRTVSLVSDVPVLKIAQQGSEESPDVFSLVTLALKPRDAQRLAFSVEQGGVWIGLLPPGAPPSRNAPASWGQVVR